MPSKFPFQFFALLSLIWIIPIEAISQQNFKFGKYEKHEIELLACEFEPNAEEVILFHLGNSHFVNGQINTNFHLRKKILTPNSKDLANISIRYYHGKDGVESVKNIKAQLVNFENGTETVHKLGKNEIFEVDLPNGYKEFRLAFPQVKAGSIIEYSYDKIDKYITFIDGWTFQNTAPTLISRYTIGIPESMGYNMLRQGQKTIQTEYTVTGNGGYSWELTNLHSIQEEPFINNYIDYLERLEFQLSNYLGRSNSGYGPSSLETVNVLNTWEKAGNDILDASNYYSYLKTKKGKEIIQGEIFEGNSDFETSKNIYKYVSENFTTTKKNGIIPSQTQKELINAKSGTKADINLIMMSLLHSKGIEANPVLISSKGNGRSKLVEYPFISQFNQLIIQAIIDGQPIYLDASSYGLPMGYLDIDNHVNQGFLLKEKDSKVIDILHNHKSGISQSVHISFDNNQVNYNNSLRFVDYEMILFKKKDLDDEESIKNHFLKDNSDNIQNFSIIENAESCRLDFKFDYVKPLQLGADIIYLAPFQYVKFSSNPFKQEYRVFPVDFKHTFSDRYSVRLTIPEGYQIEQLPENLAVTMSENEITFLSNSSMIGSEVIINIVFDMKKPIILANKYQELQTILDLIIKKVTEPIVLKKS
ncbi:DUF3857 domain-containing protein [Belliella marina]|uniref:DUF3857 domain-containing protein n=1 Tax=Belliella marina TaxID=1644146 RepID=A0ABW4VIZ8_9BACT